MSVAAKVTIKDPSGRLYTVASTTVAKNKAYVSPIVKFSKPGTYVLTMTVGSTKKTITAKVSR
jgi:hypothetical protein